ncbi:MAG: hypothetical protein IJW06_01735 [Clostridia bacterium]|nr:hypothetical protein [Clostridia bacterium]
MKKILLVLAVIALSVFMLASCTVDEVDENAKNSVDAKDNVEPVDEGKEENEEVVDEDVMTYADYVAAAIDDEVVIDAYVQGKQSWWDNKATVYTQDEDGAYFLYEMACSEEDYAKLDNGTHIKVKGYKAEWSGEVEIVDATFEIIDGNYIAKAVDATAWLGTDELVQHQNELVSFKKMTVESVSYKNDEPGDDIYVTLSKDGASYDFCVEYYLTGTETDVYKTVGELEVGDVVDVEGFLYWYNGPNPHITAISVAE